MKILHRIIVTAFILLLSACGPTPPSEEDGWHYNEELDGYQKEVFFPQNHDKTKEYVSQHQGVWITDDNPDIALIIDEEGISIAIGSFYNRFPIPTYDLKYRTFTSKEMNYEIGAEIYKLSMEPPFIVKPEIALMELDYSEMGSDITSQADYTFALVFRDNDWNMLRIFTMHRANSDYNNSNETAPDQNTSLQEKVDEDENEENKPKKETAGQRAKREAEARREQEDRRRESKRREEETARQEELEEQRKQEEEAIRLEEERRITEEREQQARIDESIKLINNIVNKHLGSFLNGEYELSFISSYKEIIQIVPNSNAYNGNIDSFFQNERLTEEEPTDEWIKLTNIMINLSKELSKEFPDQNLQIQLTDTNHTTGYLILENGEVTLDFAYY